MTESKGGGAHDTEVKGEASRPLTGEGGRQEEVMEKDWEKEENKVIPENDRMEV